MNTSEYDVVEATYGFSNATVMSVRLQTAREDMAAKHIYAIHRVRDDWVIMLRGTRLVECGLSSNTNADAQHYF